MCVWAISVAKQHPEGLKNVQTSVMGEGLILLLTCLAHLILFTRKIRAAGLLSGHITLSRWMLVKCSIANKNGNSFSVTQTKCICGCRSYNRLRVRQIWARVTAVSASRSAKWRQELCSGSATLPLCWHRRSSSRRNTDTHSSVHSDSISSPNCVTHMHTSTNRNYTIARRAMFPCN